MNASGSPDKASYEPSSWPNPLAMVNDALTPSVVVPITAAITATSEVAANVTATAGTVEVTVSAGTAEVTAQPTVAWEMAERGQIQALLERVVSLLEQSDLLGLRDGNDRLTAEGIQALLASLVRMSETPEKSVVVGPLKWLGRKVDKFLDAAAESAGKTLGPAIVVVAATYLSPLRHVLNELLGLAGQSGG